MAAWRKHVNKTDRSVNRLGYWWAVFGPGGALAVVMSTAASYLAPVYQYGWGAVVFAGVGAACVIMLAASALLAAWRYFHPLSSPNEPEYAESAITPPKNISSVRLVPSGDDLFCLVVTPGRGGVSVGVFLDWSPWQSGGIFLGAGALSPGWAKPQRFFLRDLHLRAANVKDSIKVLERQTLPLPENKAAAWMWKILSADGSPATTQPMSTSTKERVTFTFIEQHGHPEQFHFLLVRTNKDWSAPPIIVEPDDFASNAEV
jgi:hypothetical protein